MLESLRFFAGVRRNFKTVGAIAPSSGRLGRAMLRMLEPIPAEKLIVELGPGTGAITRQIRRVMPNNPVLAIEFDEVFTKRLRNRFPEVKVAHGCASRIREHIVTAGLDPDNIGGVVSGLPLLNFPPALQSQVFASIAEVLPVGGRYVQFTYSKRAWRNINPDGFSLLKSKRVFLNLPPAVVLPFERN